MAKATTDIAAIEVRLKAAPFQSGQEGGVFPQPAINSCTYPISSCRWSKLAAKPAPLGVAHLIPMSVLSADTKYPC